MLRIVPHTAPRVGLSYEHFPDGFELHLLPSRSQLRASPLVPLPVLRLALCPAVVGTLAPGALAEGGDGLLLLHAARARMQGHVLPRLVRAVKGIAHRERERREHNLLHLGFSKGFEDGRRWPLLEDCRE